MAWQLGTMAKGGLTALALALSSAQSASADTVSAAAACDAVVADDSASSPPNVMGIARREFLAALATEHADPMALARMLPRSGQPVAALIGAAPAGEARAEAVLARLGLDPERFLGKAGGTGGPFIAADEPQVRRLQADSARMSTIAATFSRIPAFMPVAQFKRSSDFGYRADPFHGGGAFHAGVDMLGGSGEAIHTAADGVVVRAGWWAGYGKVVVVDHGNGLETRYGHLSRFHVKEGDTVRQGQVIGGMGSTGRSTGTHLHFEIRVDGRAVDPQPFLDLASFGLKTVPQSRPAVLAPLNIASDEPFAPLADGDEVMAGGRQWKVRSGR